MGSVSINRTIKQNPTIADRVWEQIKSAIVTGDLPQGSKLNEPVLARHYGISRGPLREAIRRLEGVGLVRHVPHAGVRVVTLSLDELLEIYDVREALEGTAARLAAARLESGGIDDLYALLENHETDIHATNERAYFQREGDFDFHYRIIKASRNTKLIQMLLGDLYHLVRMYRYRSSLQTARPRKALTDHRRIVDALADRDGELAEFLMRRHITSARGAIEDQLGSEALTNYSE